MLILLAFCAWGQASRQSFMGDSKSQKRKLEKKQLEFRFSFFRVKEMEAGIVCDSIGIQYSRRRSTYQSSSLKLIHQSPLLMVYSPTVDRHYARHQLKFVAAIVGVWQCFALLLPILLWCELC